ncbi:hypothetical protein GmHk_06G017402 [Glycine max]|nr:hypothetical protein GmHk_06G017402 [Glycine max]
MKASMDNVKAVKAILRSYEMVSGLRINFSKSHFGAIGQSEEWCCFAADYLNFAMLQFPFCYLGLPIGINPRRKVVGWRGLEGEPQKPNFSHWWSDLRSINQHGCMVEVSKQFIWRLGIGDQILFWEDYWMDGGIALQDKYPELYLAELGSFCESGWEWKFSWRRNLFDNEMGIASDFIDQTAVINLNASWVWGAASNGILSSKSACVCIKAEQSSEDHHLGFCQLWDTKIPPRALTFAWRFLWDRLPSKENLSRRQVDLANDLCPFCQSNSKSASHLFFTCQKGLPLWWEFNTWVKEDRALHCRPMDHFLQHSSIAGSKASNTRRKIWWITATRSIWKLRNDVIFHNQAFHISKLVDNTNFLTWSWLRGWIWALSSNHNQLWARILMSKYGGWSDLCNVRDKAWHSQWWKDLRKLYQ